MRSAAWNIAAACALLAGITGCEDKLEGPSPSLADGQDGVWGVDPAYACRAKAETEVSVVGENLSASVSGVPDDATVVLPTLTLSRGRALNGEPAPGRAQVVFGGRPDGVNATRLSWDSESKMRARLGPDMVVTTDEGTASGPAPVGLYDLAVTLAQGAATTLPSALAVVERPSVTTLTPSLTCVAQGPRTLRLGGADLMTIADALPTLSVGEVDLGAVTPSACVDVAHPFTAGAVCAAATREVSAEGLPEGDWPIVLHNPAPADCDSAEDIRLRVVPAPSITALEPSIVCVTEGARVVEVRGADLLRVDGENPSVTMKDAGGVETALTVVEALGCEALETQGHAVERCTALKVEVPQRSAEAPFRPVLTVRNPDPAGCEAATSTGLTIVPPPVIGRAEPSLTCTAQGERDALVVGEGFLDIDGVLPEWTLAGASAALVRLEECDTLEVEGYAQVRRCRHARVTWPAETPALGEGGSTQPTIGVTNPQPAGCGAEVTGPLTVAAPPSIVAADPPVVCATEGPRPVILQGRDLLRVGAELPSVTMTGPDGQPVALEVVRMAGDCAPVDVALLEVERCDAVEVIVPAAALDAPYRPTLTLTNPAPAGCESATSEALTLVPAPRLDAVTPSPVCAAQGARVLTLNGEGFLRLDGARPTVAVDGRPAEVVELGACEPLPVADVDAERCSSATVRLAAGELLVDPASVGRVAAVRLENPAPAGCSTTLDDALVSVPAPEVMTVTPALVCAAQGAREVVVTGRGFLSTAAGEPTARLGDVAVAVSPLAECTPLPLDQGQSCARLSVTIAPETPLADAAPLVLTNPGAADCVSSGEAFVTVVAPPEVERFEPSVVEPSTVAPLVTLRGRGFLRVGGALPSVSASNAEGIEVPLSVERADGCVAVGMAGLAVERCDALAVRWPVETVAVAYRPAVRVTNPAPAGCDAQTTRGLVVVPPARLDVAGPVFLCDGDAPSLALAGRDLLEVDGRAPTVTLDGAQALNVAPDRCEIVATQAEDGVDVRLCLALRVGVDGAAAAGNVTVRVTSPAPVDAVVEGSQAIIRVESPRVDAVEPTLACTEDRTVELQVRGAHFFAFDPALPSVRIGGVDAATIDTQGCVDASAGGLAWKECDAVVVRLPVGALPADELPRAADVEVIGPIPAACLGVAPDAVAVPPTVRVDALGPPRVCVAVGPRDVSVSGAGLLRVGAARAALEVGGLSFEAAALDACVPLIGGGIDGEACTEAAFTLPQDALPPGVYATGVQNPDACGAQSAFELEVLALPEIDSVEPDEVCEVESRRLTIRGRFFRPDSRVTLGDIEAERVEFVDPQTLVAIYDLQIAPGLYDLSVDNGDGCVDVLPEAVRVFPTPVVFFVDPPVVYNGIELQVTVYTSGLDAPPSLVELLGPAGEVVAVPFTTRDGRPNKILATLPLGLATGDWGVRVTSRIGCVGSVPGAMRVTDDLRLDLAGIEPAHASPTRPTAVTLTAVSPPGAGRIGFVSTPRAYLNPTGGARGVLAVALRAVTFVDATRLTAVVPPALTPGLYDLVVVNPDGTVGVNEGALTVTQGEPPVVAALEPASLDANGEQPARILGEHFTTDGVSIVLACQTAAGDEVRLPARIQAGSLTETGLTALLPAGQAGAGSVCVVELTNSDGALFRYSAVSIKNPAQNLGAWSIQSDLVEARRAPGVVAARPTATSRLLYAIGGDSGSPATARSTVESIPVDLYGGLTEWSLQRNALPAPRTLAGATRIGRTVFVVGGSDGAAATSTVFAAEVLDPLAGPEVTDVDLTLEPGAGLAAGLWHYRVSALFGPDDTSNPSGESLPGEVLVAQLPALEGLRLRLDWSAVPNAVGYRVYRTRQAGDGVDDVVHLADTVGGASTSFVDEGAVPVSEETPLPPGSLGRWYLAGSLGTERASAGVVSTPAPAAEGGGAYLYAFGGRTTNGQPVASYEFARVTLDALGNARLGPFATGPQSLGTARADLVALHVSDLDNPAIPVGTPWIFIGPGRTANGFARNVEAGEVGPGGALTALITTDAVSADLAGYGAGAANGFLFCFGGRSGAADDTGISAEMCRSSNDPGCGAAPNEPPDLRNWNNLGTRLQVARAFPGTTEESAFFFVIGGVDGAGRALRSTERNVQ